MIFVLLISTLALWLASTLLLIPFGHRVAAKKRAKAGESLKNG